MKKRILFTLLLSIFIVNGAIAGPAKLVGDWEGVAEAILPSGTIISDIELFGTLEVPEDSDGLFYGFFEFTLPESEPIEAYATGYIKAQKIQGIMSFKMGEDVFQGIGFFNAKLKGKKMVGVVRDLSDGSTTHFTAKRIQTE